jgi:GWxTD domain-containing protein
MKKPLSKKSLLIFFTLSFLLSCSCFVYAQEYQRKSPFFLSVEMSRFIFSPDKAYLEVSYAVSPSNVTLVRVADTLHGSIILNLQIKNTQNDSLIVRSLFSIPITIADTALLKTSSISKTTYVVPFGSFELVVQGYDSRNPMRKDSVVKRFSIDYSRDLPAISDIDLCLKILPSDEKKSIFYKNSYEVIPNPSLLFGGKESPVVFSYAEFYQLKQGTVYSVVVDLIDSKGSVIKRKKSIHKYSARNVVDVNSLNVNTIQSGKYRYVLILADTLDHEITRSEKTIYIHNPQIASQASASVSAKSAEFAGLSDKELVDEFREARFIASTEDIKAFDKLTTIGAKREFLAKFWTDRENDYNSATKILRSAYLKRVLTANQRYGAMGRNGWNTDRGRIYILYGEPDEVERIPNSDNAKPYEIWHYYQIESGVQFIFIDRSGFSEYILVHSTKRGELQDEGWQRYLR